MSREEIFKGLHEVFWDVFDDESIVLTDETTSADVAGWDSLQHINLIVSVEEEFEMKFTMGEVSGMKNIGEMVDLIMQRV